MPDELDLLLERVSEACRLLPGTTELHLFGSSADPARRDKYSDLDLQVVSGHYWLSLAAWPGILSLAGRLTLIYPLGNKPRATAYTVAFAEFSPYHKLDIGLSAAGDPLPGVLDEPQRLLWRQSARLAPTPYPLHSAYQPEPGSAAHFITGQMLAAVRYIKARKRGQALLCWRYLSAAIHALLISLRWDGDPLRFDASPLSNRDYQQLDLRLPAEERALLFAALDLRTPQAADRALLITLRQLAERIWPEYAAGDDELAGLIRRCLAFTAEELGLT